MDELRVLLQNLFTNKNENISHFYSLLADFLVTEENEQYTTETLIPGIYQLCDRGVLRKDFLYLALLAGQNHVLLEKITDYDKRTFVLNVKDPVSLYDYCIYHKTHWISEVIENLDQYEKIKKNKKLYSKLNMVKFVYETNLDSVDITYLQELLDKINLDDLGDFWIFYAETTKKVIDTVIFCKSFSEVCDQELFNFATTHSLLDTLTHFCDLRNSNTWEFILNKLECPDDINTFTSFVIIGTLYKFVINQEIPQSDKIYNWLIKLQNEHLQLEVLETIMSLLLHKTNNQFTCKENEIRYILTLLKKTIEELQLKKIIERDTENYKKITNLNKQVTDCLWRLELIINTKKGRKVEERLLSYMLAPPEALIAICLKENHFERARQVVEVFDLRGSDLGNLVTYFEEYHTFKENVHKKDVHIDKNALNFFQNHTSIYPKIGQQQSSSSELKFFPNFSKNIDFFGIFDFLLTETNTWKQSELILNLMKQHYKFDSFESTYLIFYKKLVEIAEVIGPKENISIPEILTTYSLDLSKYQKQQEFYNNLGILYDEFQKLIQMKEPGIFNKNHQSHRIFMKMNQLIETYKSHSEDHQYLAKLFNYLKAFSKVLYIEQNSSEVIANGINTSYFDLLNFNRSELTGKLLFEKQLDPTEFEKYFGELKLDFLYHIVGNCFPTVNLHINEDVTIAELYHDNMLYIPSSSIIVYIQKRNWLLALILKEMYRNEDIKIDISESRLKTFFNYIKHTRIQYLKALFEKNEIMASLQNCINPRQVKAYFRQEIVQQDLSSIHSQNSKVPEVLETGQEIQEDTKTTNWKDLLETVESIPEGQMRRKSELLRAKDNVLVSLVRDRFEPDFPKYSYFISNEDLRINTILNNIRKWRGPIACNIIRCETSRFCPNQQNDQLYEWLDLIELNHVLKDMFILKSWSRSHTFCINHPDTALDDLLLMNKIDYLLKFINIYKPSAELLIKITSDHFVLMFETDVAFDKIKSLLDILPPTHALSICRSLLTTLKDLSQLQFLSDYLLSKQDDLNLIRIHTSLQMLTVFNIQEREPFFCLIDEPMHILEVLLMNTKLDKLSAILDLLYSSNNEVVTVEMVDQLLRQYAEKSLDFRVNTNPNKSNPLRTSDCILLQSFDSLSVASSGEKRFVMPDVIPTKDEWTQNEEVTECMCCKQITFSMFNRRHHCRRCGRVICYNCSLKRMLVPSYNDILVRVCIDCFNQTEGTESEPSNRSFINQYWLLNNNPQHNKITREEFSYEHAPSTSLCLSILKYHSRTPEFVDFLLEQCDAMLKLLQPTQQPTHEIDYLLGIKMLRSLAMAAKMVPSGSLIADSILSQADLLALLAEKGCLHLCVESNTLRTLRDKLIHLEEWNLALEVSTKAGLDNTGVFAAWGKTCLKAGCLLAARDKFQRCLDKSNRQSESLDGQSRLSISSSISMESKPNKDPPLLHEIIHILEMKNESIKDTYKPIISSESITSLNQIVRTDIAISVLNRIKHAKEIASGNYFHSGKQIPAIFYQECVYYLTRYGTHLTLLEFYVRHGNLKAVLIYVLENRISCELFVEIYMKCLKLGIVTTFQEQMSLIDSSLELWKDYLKHLCRYLETQQLLNSLYQLQLYIGDYVRASITCMRFYEENVQSFIELKNNVGHLYKGEEHLKQILEQEQWVEVSETSSSKGSFEERMLSNPDLVMKIETKDVNRHIHTVKRQIEVVNYLAECESFGVNSKAILREMNAFTDEEREFIIIPTLFGTNTDKITLCVLLLASGETVEQGFELCVKIMKDFKIKPIKVYCLAGKFFAKCGRYTAIGQLVNCIKCSENNDAAISDMLDEMLSQTVVILINENVEGTKVEDLIKLIKDRAMKISAYIEAKQLKTAYFLAVKFKRTEDIRRIQREAELLNMPQIKALCQKVLQTPHHSKD